MTWLRCVCLAVLCAACAASSVHRRDKECGDFESTSIGFQTMEEYDAWRARCAAEQFAKTVAANRAMIVAAAYRAVETTERKEREAKMQRDQERSGPERLGEALVGELRVRGKPPARLAVLLSTCRADERTCADVRNRVEAILAHNVTVDGNPVPRAVSHVVRIEVIGIDSGRYSITGQIIETKTGTMRSSIRVEYRP